MEHLGSLLERALDAVVGMDAEGRVTAWNAAAEEMFGWSRVDAIGRMMGELIVPPQHRQAHAHGLQHYLDTGEGPVLEKRIRITAMHRTGKEFPVELSIFAMGERGPDQVFYGFLRSREAEEEHAREQELRAREAETLMKIGQKLIQDVPLAEFARYCLLEVCSIAGLDAGHLYLVRGRGSAQTLVSSGIWHLQDERFRPIIDITAKTRLKIGEGLPGKAWEQRDLVALENLVDEAAFVRRKVFGDVGLTRAVAIPVEHGSEVHAVIEFFGTADSRIDDAFLRMLKTVGSQIGAAIQAKESAEHRETLRREMVHRMGNSLMVLSSIYRSCSRRAATKEELDQAFLGRVDAMGRANRRAIMEAQQGASLLELVNDTMGIFPDRDFIEVDVPDVQFYGEQVMPISLVLNELATNALKYGQLGSGSTLAISGSLDERTGELDLKWEERLDDEAPPISVPKELNEGFGSQLIRIMVESRMGGTFERNLDQRGFRFRMRVPAVALDQTRQ